MADEMVYETEPMPRDYMISNQLYDIGKYVSQIVLPAAGALYAALAVLWGFPHGEEVVGSIAAIATFLGTILGLSTRSYNRSEAKYDGHIVVEETEDKKTFSLNLNEDPDALEFKNEALFKIDK